LRRTVLDLEEFSEAVVRRTIYSFSIIEKIISRVESLRIKLQETIDFQGGEIIM
jgi:hypothetical protein